MYRLMPAMIAVALLMIGGPARAQADWNTHSYPDLSVTIEMPGEPTRSRDEGEGVGETVIDVELGRTGAMMLRITDEALPDANQQTRLDAAVEAGARAVDAQILKRERTTYAGWPARDLTICSDRFRMCARIRMIMIEGRLHQLLVAYALGSEPPEGTQRFLDSLKVGPRGLPI